MIKLLHLLKKKTKLVLIPLREALFSITHKNYIVHIGHFSKGERMIGNVGDPVLFRELEILYDHINGEKNVWLHRAIGLKITRFEVWLYNKFAKAVIVGGHGLLMVDTGRNENSGWQFNITLSDLRKLKVPLAILAIGYNTFRGQKDFIPIFREHINECVSKSIIFGLRNYGSMEALKPYLNGDNVGKITFQPCPTTMLALYEQYKVMQPAKRIAICLAFDRFKNRFGDSFEHIISKIDEYAYQWKRKGYDILFFIHNETDLNDSRCMNMMRKYGILCLSGMYPHEIFEFYRSQKLVVGMRGHSLMIPWGLQVPVLSLTTQNKQKWFIETTDHPEYSIEILDSNFFDILNEKTTYILNNYEEVVQDIVRKQKEFYEITNRNFKYISNEITKNYR